MKCTTKKYTTSVIQIVRLEESQYTVQIVLKPFQKSVKFYRNILYLHKHTFVPFDYLEYMKSEQYKPMIEQKSALILYTPANRKDKT